MDRRIHIIGTGNVGTFVAHALRGIPNPPPVTLIFSRRQKRDQWEQSAKKITLVTDDEGETREGYDVEFATPRVRFHGKEIGTASDETQNNQTQDGQSYEGESNEPISSLIVCSKTPHVLQHLSAVKHRLTKNSVILFLQNGMGTTEEVSREIFPDPATRPFYMLGINSHGLNNASAQDFTTTHAGFGTILLGILPHDRERDANSPYLAPTKFTRDGRVEPPSIDSLDDDYSAPTSTGSKWSSNQRYLLRTLLRTPVLSAAAFSPSDLLQLQLEKLVANCIINPLTVLLDARNGSVLYNYAISRTMRLLLAEISLVIRSLPELQYIPNVQTRFDPGRLETVVVGVANKTKDNISSMLADVRAGRQTEIDYINGWIVKRGEDLGIRCVMNYMLMQMVKGKQALISREMGEDVPALEEEKGQYDIKIREQATRPKEKL